MDFCNSMFDSKLISFFIVIDKFIKFEEMFKKQIEFYL